MAGSIALEQKSLRVQTVKIGESFPVSSGDFSVLTPVRCRLIRLKLRLLGQKDETRDSDRI